MLQEPDSYLTLNKYLDIYHTQGTPPFPENVMRLIHHITNSHLDMKTL